MSAMTSRERMVTALENGRPDRMPCQVHAWMPYYLGNYLGGVTDWMEAYARFDMDCALYVDPVYSYSNRDMANWQVERCEQGVNERGYHSWEETITTPGGVLHHAGAWNLITDWETEPLVKTKEDFEIWDRYMPQPVSADLTAVRNARERVGDKGIVRCHPYGYNQGSPWQSYCTLVGTEAAIITAMTEPDYLQYALDRILHKTLRVLDMWEGISADMVETDGGAGSSTVISPNLFRQFCLPYDRKQNAVLHQLGLKIVCHLCGGLMPMLDLVVETGADGLETMTPPSMGGDCDLAEASRRVGGKLFFIGGFDQLRGFEQGTPATARRLVLECFEATRDHAGYICCPSDHFFHGDPANVQAFADAAKECVY